MKPNRRVLLERLEWGAVLVLSGLFLYAGVMKLLDTGQFYRDIQSYRLTPDVLSWWAAHYLPWLELVAGVALFLPKFRLPAALIFAGLMSVFTLALLSAWSRGLDISCGCFGSSTAEANYPWLVGRDLGLLLMALFLVWRNLLPTTFFFSRGVAKETSLELAGRERR